MEPFAVNTKNLLILLNPDPKVSETLDRGKTISSLQKIGDLCHAIR